MDRFNTGMEIGQAIQRISHAEGHISELTTKVEKLGDELKGLRTTLTRGSILVALWLTGIAGNLGAEVAGKALGAAIVKALKLG